MTGKLTTHMVEGTKMPSDGQAFLWDGELKGFGVRIGSSGVKSKVLQYRSLDGRLRRSVYGSMVAVPAWASRLKNIHSIASESRSKRA